VSLPYESATAGDRALLEVQKTLKAFGCQAFGTMTDEERGVMIVAFKWRNRQVHLEASWKGYAQALVKSRGWDKGHGPTRQKNEQKALEQARKSVCSVLRDWIKGQTTAVECGVMSFEAAFMPHMLLPSGQRLVDHIESQKLLGAPE
jgi:hypothetical protein